MGAGLYDGDWLPVDEFLRPQHDDIVVAEMDGDFTCKRLSSAPAACVQLCRVVGRRSAISDGMHARGRCMGVGWRAAEHLAELDVHTEVGAQILVQEGLYGPTQALCDKVLSLHRLFRQRDMVPLVARISLLEPTSNLLRRP
ncbi:S24 family peptidase [Comamonas testosteroni]|nr:S24 family peptidase [Comamonas testosteroni]